MKLAKPNKRGLVCWYAQADASGRVIRRLYRKPSDPDPDPVKRPPSKKTPIKRGAVAPEQGSLL